VARWCMGYPYESVQAITKGIQFRGFSFIEMLAPFPTSYGKKNKMKEGREGWDWYKENTILKSKYDALTRAEQKKSEKIVIGELQNMERATFAARWDMVVEKVKKG